MNNVAFGLFLSGHALETVNKKNIVAFGRFLSGHALGTALGAPNLIEATSQAVTPKFRLVLLILP
jgi:hypothetical protein